MQIPIIYEDEYIICVSKPNNVVVHHAYHSRNVANEASLLQLLATQIGKKLYPIHRLDRKTSGIILLAKQTKYVAKFQELFTKNTIQKTYFAVVRGHTPDYKTIDSPVKGRDSKVHKEALTHLQTLEKIELPIPVKPYNSSRYSLVSLQPKTGRMHQLRIHMNKISHPIIGDAKYGDNNHNRMFEMHFEWDNLFLHAYSLEFIHPFFNKKQTSKSSLPVFWIELLNKFQWSNKIF